MTVLIPILLAINLIVAVLIILVTLMQRPKQEGLGAAFGGGMTENLFGAQTTNVLVSITRWLGGIFFGVTLLISILYAKQSTTTSPVQKQLLESPKPTPAAEAEAPAVPSVPATPETKAPEAVTPEAPAPTPAPAAPEATPAVEAPAAEAPQEAPTETPAAEAPAAPAETPAATPAP